MCVVFLLKWRITCLHQKFCQYFSKLNNFCALSFQILTPSLVTLASRVLLPSRDATQLEGLTVYPSDKEALPSTGYNCKESPAHSKSMESTTFFMEPRIKEVVQKSYLQILIPSYWQLKICWNVSWMSRKEKSVRFTYHTNLHINHKQKHDILGCQKKTWNLKNL